MADATTAQKAAAAKKKATAPRPAPEPEPPVEEPAAAEPEAVEDEPRYPLPAAPAVAGEVRQDYALPEEWAMAGEGGWPAPLDRMPDLEGLAQLRREFAPEFIEKLPKNITDGPASQCRICHGYHKPASVHLDYVGHAAVTDRLLSVDPLWWWEPYAEDPLTKLPLLDYDASNRPVGMWIKLHVAGRSIIGYGTAAPKPDAVKEIIGDAIRNAAMRLGVALSLWTKGELESLSDSPDAELQREAAPRPPERDQATGQPVITKGQREALIARFDAIEDDTERKHAKRDWLAAMRLEDPRKLTQDRLKEATDWIIERVGQYLVENAAGEEPDGGDTPTSVQQEDDPTIGADVPTSPVAPAPSEPSPPPPTPEPEPEPEAPPAERSVWVPADGETMWEGELAVSPSGIELFPREDYIGGIETLLNGVTPAVRAEFEAWLEGRGWASIDPTEFPQWALHYTFGKLMAVTEAATNE